MCDEETVVQYLATPGDNFDVVGETDNGRFDPNDITLSYDRWDEETTYHLGGSGHTVILIDGDGNHISSREIPDSDTLYTAGDGLELNDEVFSIDLATDSGLQFDGGDLRIGAGDGIARSSGDISVRLADNPGLQFDSGNLHVGAGIAITRSGGDIDVDVDINTLNVTGDGLGLSLIHI